ISDAQIAPHLPYIGGLAFVDEGGVSRDDEEPTQARQRIDDVLSNAVTEIFLLGIAGHVGKRQDRDGRLFRHLGYHRAVRDRQWRCRARTPRRSRPPLAFADCADEANALAGDSTDKALFLAAITDRLTSRSNPAGEGGVRNDASAPHVLDQVILADH